MRLFVLSLLACCLSSFLSPSTAADWVQFRGAEGRSATSQIADLPVKWGDNQNIAWRVDLPGRGPSGPIVVSDRVYVTASSGKDQERLHVLCFDQQTGEQLWHREFWATGRTMVHPTSANAAPTPASDGEAIYAFFSSNDLVCLELNGDLRWYRGLAYDFPKAGNDIGMSSSPVVAEGTVIVQVENQGDSFVAGIETPTGTTRWRVDRPKIANWTSPLIAHDAEGKAVALVKSSKGLDAFDLQSGEHRWRYEVSAGGIPSLSARDGEVILPANGLTALEIPIGKTTPHVRWVSNRLNPGKASPIVTRQHVYCVNNAGVLTCASLSDGKVQWQLRLGGTYWATPVVAGNHMFCINDKGQAKVVRLDGDEGEIVATNQFNETIQASPAVSGNAIFVRSDQHLWKISASN